MDAAATPSMSTKEVTFDRRTQHAKAIRIREIVTGDQLGLDFGSGSI